jgi:anthranilate/para-aminobenzoate synthase component II
MLVEGVRVVLVCDRNNQPEAWVSLLTDVCNGQVPVLVSPDEATAENLRKYQSHRIIALEPLEAAVYLELLEEIPILAGPLAMASFVAAYGGQCLAVGAEDENYLMHDAVGLWTGFTEPLEVTGYPSLAMDKSCLPKDLVVTAWNDEMVALGIGHRTMPQVALNFNPFELEDKYCKDLILAFLEGTYLTGVPVGPPEI